MVIHYGGAESELWYNYDFLKNLLHAARGLLYGVGIASAIGRGATREAKMTKLTAEQAQKAGKAIMADARFTPAIKADVFRGLSARQADGGYRYTSNADCGRANEWYDVVMINAAK